MRRILLAAALAVPSVLTVAATPAHAAAAKTYTVNTGLDVPWSANACPKKVKNKCSLRAAITQANMDNANDLINVPINLYSLTVPDATGNTQLVISAPMRIVGGGAGHMVIDGNNTGRIFRLVAGADATISKMTITHGTGEIRNSTAVGGAIEVDQDAGLTLNDVIVEQNVVGGFGAGINNYGFATLNRIRVTGNVAGMGGMGGGAFQGNGAGINNFGDMAIHESTIDANDGNRGSGINNDGGELFVVNSTISGNTARTSGGGIRTFDGGLTMVKFTTITDNWANSTPRPGPGMPPRRGDADDPDSWGGENGGGLVVAGGTVQVGGNIIAGNTAFAPSGLPQVGDCFSIGDIVSSAGNNLWTMADPRCRLDTAQRDRFGDPKLTFPLGPNDLGAIPTHALQTGSAAIDAASQPFTDDWFACESTDERGKKRPVAKLSTTKICDIGSYEVQ